MDIFWERQEGKLCRKHSLNAYFGCAKISTPKFIEYCTQYNEYIYEKYNMKINIVDNDLRDFASYLGEFDIQMQ